MKKRINATENGSFSKRMRLLEMPNIGSVTSIDDMNIKLLVEQNSHLGCTINQLKAKEAMMEESIEKMKSYEEYNDALIAIIKIILEEAFDTLFGHLFDYSDDLFKEMKTKYSSILGINTSFERLTSSVNECVRNKNYQIFEVRNALDSIFDYAHKVYEIETNKVDIEKSNGFFQKTQSNLIEQNNLIKKEPITTEDFAHHKDSRADPMNDQSIDCKLKSETDLKNRPDFNCDLIPDSSIHDSFDEVTKIDVCNISQNENIDKISNIVVNDFGSSITDNARPNETMEIFPEKRSLDSACLNENVDVPLNKKFVADMNSAEDNCVSVLNGHGLLSFKKSSVRSVDVESSDLRPENKGDSDILSVPADCVVNNEEVDKLPETLKNNCHDNIECEGTAKINIDVQKRCSNITSVAKEQNEIDNNEIVLSKENLKKTSTDITKMNSILKIHNYNKVKSRSENLSYKSCEIRLKICKSKYSKMKEEAESFKCYISELEHKLLMMRKRYDEQMSYLEKKSSSLDEEIKKAVQEVESRMNVNEKSNGSSATDMNINEELLILRNEIDIKNKKIHDMQSYYQKVESDNETLRDNMIKLELTNELNSKKVVFDHPDYLHMKSKLNNAEISENELRNDLMVLFNAFSEFTTSFKSRVDLIQKDFVDSNKLLMNYIYKLENEYSQFKYHYLTQKVMHNHLDESISHKDEVIQNFNTMIISLKSQNKFYSDKEKEYREKLYTQVESTNNMDTFEDMSSLCKKLKFEQEAIISEMELTAQTYEDSFEHNLKLTRAIDEKQNSNLKLSSELFKSSQLLKSVSTHSESVNNMKLKFDELLNKHESSKNFKEFDSFQIKFFETFNKFYSENDKKMMNLQSELDTVTSINNKTLLKIEDLKKSLIDANIDLRKKDAILNDMNLNLQNCKNKLKEKDREISKERNLYLNNSNNDVILAEQVKMYKTRLTCSCCNSNDVDAILIKCLHMFCYSCLKTRHDTRQRKCPRCNAPFGHSDFHKVYF